MRKVKWIFFAYMAMVALIVCGIGMSFAVVSARDPNTLYVTIVSQVPLGAGVKEPSVYPEVEDLLGKPLAHHALA